MWTDMTSRGLSIEDASEELLGRLEETFTTSWSIAERNGQAIELAAAGLPIWNVATQSLIPGNLGNLRIYTARDYEFEAKGLGQSYGYRTADSDHHLTLYLYANGEANVLVGTADSRTLSAAQQAVADALAHVTAQGGLVEGEVMTGIETLRSRLGDEYATFGAAFSWQAEHIEPRWEAISMTGFRGVFAKQRYSTLLRVAQTEDTETAMSIVNADYADYLTLFGGRSNTGESAGVA